VTRDWWKFVAGRRDLASGERELLGLKERGEGSRKLKVERKKDMSGPYTPGHL
jgi:hypothetical protein